MACALRPWPVPAPGCTGWSESLLLTRSSPTHIRGRPKLVRQSGTVSRDPGGFWSGVR